jgi:hypothetical protein
MIDLGVLCGGAALPNAMRPSTIQMVRIVGRQIRPFSY